LGWNKKQFKKGKVHQKPFLFSKNNYAQKQQKTSTNYAKQKNRYA